MLKIMEPLITFSIIAVHLIIMYFWIFDWEKLITPIGLAGWGGSIIAGFMAYAFYAAKERRKYIQLQRHILIGSTVITVCLAVLALIIEWITSSMP
ncbi:hypothetical protein HT574_14820 [Parageobacillus sp. VR-IP]|uniref:hypothetical protein n=1 Tax=Parageobacillus sp. VR-IP TaxID=2742205 RepID=UPI00158312D8|nr:hypothetical protein [Parageobacillus sp. VR-IP]NUK31321.1 hypothetical protein [Parageobacillus sp. VR-IP]